MVRASLAIARGEGGCGPCDRFFSARSVEFAIKIIQFLHAQAHEWKKWLQDSECGSWSEPPWFSMLPEVTVSRQNVGPIL